MPTEAASHSSVRRSSAALVSTDAAAQALGVSRRTVERMAANGQLPAFRLGKRLWKFDPFELGEFVAKGRQA